MTNYSAGRFWGLLAEYPDKDTLIRAVGGCSQAGLRKIDAFSPFPIEEIWPRLPKKGTRLPFITLGGAIAGGIIGYAMQYYLSTIDYPINVGGRPLHSWPAFVPVTFELTILGAAFCTVVGMLALNGLPEPYHPLFNVDRFADASDRGFFLAVDAADKKFQKVEVQSLLKSLGATEVFDVDY
jgi:hypothetical protein